jgi:hypothetical protein
MLGRTLTSYLQRDAGFYPVVTLTGPRQSGKTTLARSAFPDHDYVSLEDPDARAFALEDPRGFLDRFAGPVILDEAQRAPDLFSYIQGLVDDDDTPGRFVLTGSHNFLLMSGISQSLAGRSAVLHLLPFSRAELEGHAQAAPDDPRALFENDESSLSMWPAIHTGFYPRIHDRDIPTHVWMPDYVQTYVERDVRTLVNIGDLSTFEQFLRLCAGRVGQLLSYSSLANDCGVSVDTARRWLSVLETSFILFRLPPHFRNFNKRLVKSPKIYFHDTGLACYLLGIREADMLPTHPLRGALFENYVMAEVAKAFVHHRQQPEMHFWRDRTGREIDLLLARGEELYPVEIKSGKTVAGDALQSLSKWSAFAGQPVENATLVYGGDQAFVRSGVSVRPWFGL